MIAGEAGYHFLREFIFAIHEHMLPGNKHVVEYDQGFLTTKLRVAFIDVARALGAPVRRTAEELAAMLERAPLGLMTIPASGQGMAPRVRRIMVETPGASLVDIAGRVRIPPATLRRRLQQEGIRLSDLREDVRKLAAIRALANSGRSIDSISVDLGYAEPRSFTRAFRAWTGVSRLRIGYLPTGLIERSTSHAYSQLVGYCKRCQLSGRIRAIDFFGGTSTIIGLAPAAKNNVNISILTTNRLVAKSGLDAGRETGVQGPSATFVQKNINEGGTDEDES